MSDREDREAIEAREEASRRVIYSQARRRLIVAGAGTGKTHTFRGALEAVGGGGLALTFIRNLVHDLATDLSELADVFTFHGFATHLLHRIAVAGITPDFDFYPPFYTLVTEDLRILGRERPANIELALYDRDDRDGLITGVIEAGDYYDTVSFNDVVYRVLRHLETAADDIPSYPLIVVDEYQDFSLLETSLITLLGGKSPTLIAGDDDQALYTFKHASAIYLRELAEDPQYERFELPFCSRCPAVIVEAVQSVIGEAQRRHLLQGRLERPYQCFLPEKEQDSERHPKIIHAHCSVENSRAPYICRYVAQQIAEIPPEDVRESHEKHYPTALVIGPGQFVRRVHAFLAENGYPQAQHRASDPLPIDLAHGYDRLTKDENSRLGWRILLHCEPYEGASEAIRAAREGNIDLATLLPAEYRAYHLEIARLLHRVATEEELEKDEKQRLERAMGRELAEIRRTVTREQTPAEREQGPEQPSITCTTLVGAKGLSAGYVFIVGFNDGHFPQNPRDITDEDVCKLIVGLSRTRKECHLVSCGRFGKEKLYDSSFLRWVEHLTERRTVNKKYWSAGNPPGHAND